jgi:hypothetical protein
VSWQPDHPGEGDHHQREHGLACHFQPDQQVRVFPSTGVVGVVLAEEQIAHDDISAQGERIPDDGLAAQHHQGNG